LETSILFEPVSVQNNILLIQSTAIIDLWWEWPYKRETAVVPFAVIWKKNRFFFFCFRSESSVKQS
jgi:hypothetical protein